MLDFEPQVRQQFLNPIKERTQSPLFSTILGLKNLLEGYSISEDNHKLSWGWTHALYQEIIEKYKELQPPEVIL